MDQEQSAGDHSEQYQAGRDMHVEVHGVTAADVVAITRSEVSRVREELTAAAEAVAADRLRKFESRILEQFEQNDHLRGAFADPDFQFSLRDAGRAAVSNDDQHTEDLLVDLLKNRAEQGNQARVRLATSQAIRAADKLSLEALNGVTGLWALQFLKSGVPGVAPALRAGELVATGLVGMGLPDDPSWTEDADALNLVRLGGGGMVMERARYRDFMARREPGIPLNPGIDQEASRDLIEAARSKCPWLEDKLQPHPLRPGFLLLVGDNAEEFLAAVPADSEAPPELHQLVSMNNFGVQDQTVIAAFGEKVDECENLREVADWWDRVPNLDLTVVGRVIGFVNARRHVEFGGARTVAELLAASRSHGDGGGG
jgi:hypothetical protein